MHFRSRKLQVQIGAVLTLACNLAVCSEVDFARQIQTILARRCYACHGPDLQEGGLRFDDRATILGQSDSGRHAIVPGQSADSELIRRISAEDESERMPPEGKPLSVAEVQLFTQWINEGADYQPHWAFQPVQRLTIPDVSDAAWAKTPIDRFVLSRMEQAGLVPVAPASTVELIRRVYLDIVGLPPAPEVVVELAAHWGEDSYERLVDQLLADPAFGDRWARPWLDVVRFAETNSFERDGDKPNVWKYRDYVIQAMMDDKPYNQFIREQIAGDELDVVTHESLTATGYYRLGIWDDEPADPLQAEFDGYDDLVSTTSQGILGLTLNCARCHDHKIDPLTQKDYYSMLAFMRDVTPYAERGDQRTNNQIDLDPEVARQHSQYQARRQQIEKQTKRIEKDAIVKMSATDQRATEGPERPGVLRKLLQQYVDADAYAEYRELQAELKSIAQQEKLLPAQESVLGLAQLDAHPQPTHLLVRGSPHSQGEAVDMTFPKLLGGGKPIIPDAELGASSAGRRRVLADWLASDDNWMTARVIVNRVWLQYFGRGIVRSPNNFGLMGDPPTHPELLDFLATELIRNDWHLKSIHRMILLSSTYRLSTKSSEESLAKDPANQCFWRQNLRRLSAEQVRDSVLAVTGQLNEERFGESMYPSLSAEVHASQSRPGSGWGDSTAGQQARRSIYIFVKRSLPVPQLSVFDFPETDISCEARFLTTQPGQALTMLNSEWMQQQAAQLQSHIQGQVGQELSAQAERCLELVLSRPADPQDVAELISLAQNLVKKHGMSDTAARQAMCLVSLNLNEFLYLD